MAGRGRGATLSELEGCVLGLVWRDGPCTPYAVRRELRGSPNPHWGHSAGSIYPVFRRLEKASLISAEPHATGARKGFHYRVTAAGRRALRRWLGPPVSELSAALPPDPLRTRMAFLGVLEKTEQLAFLDSARSRIEEQLERVDPYRTRFAHDPHARLVSDGAAATIRTRLDWIHAAGRALGQRPPRSSRKEPPDAG